MWRTFYDGEHGRSGRWEDHKSDRTGYERKSSGYFVRMFWRRKDAGRDRFSYADGENGGCAETAQWKRASVCERFNRPDDRRSNGKLCHAWRYYSGRAECADRVCRTEGDRADDRKEAAERISEVGVFARTWICRSDRRAVGNEKRSCAYFAYAWPYKRKNRRKYRGNRKDWKHYTRRYYAKTGAVKRRNKRVGKSSSFKKNRPSGRNRLCEYAVFWFYGISWRQAF